MALETYRTKRKFGITPEPRGRAGRRGGNRYVIQKHAARRLHYDLRLELDGLMKSWAVARGPSLDPSDKRLAVHVEDHPVEYNSFEGTIPAGEYGGGTVMIWDRGRWIPQGDPHAGYAKGHLIFDLEGHKLHGRWHLVRMRGRRNKQTNNWLLIKGKDNDARAERGDEILDAEPLSVVSGRSMEEIAEGRGRKRVWHSKRKSTAPSLASRFSQNAFKAELRAQAQAKAKTKTRSGTGPKSTAGVAKNLKAQTASVAVPSAEMSGVPRRRAAARAARPVRGAGAILPEFVPPCLATLREIAPSGSDWLHEIKFDGYRIEARLDHGRVQLFTRHRQNWTDRFRPIVEAVAALPARTALLDGELVVEDDTGVSNFSLLQTDLKEGRTDRFVYWVFDLLHLDGRDLTGEPLMARKATLRELLRGFGRNGPIRYTGHFNEEGPVVFKHACEMGLEGIVSKRKNAPYRSGRSENFIKAKCRTEQEFVVVGFTRSAAKAGALGALTVAFHENGKLRYAGRIGTGYTHAIARDLWIRLSKLRTDHPMLAIPKNARRKDVIWVKPQMVVEAEFRGMSRDGLLRQASYKGLREDKLAREVVREAPTEAGTTMASKARGRAGQHSSMVTSQAVAATAKPLMRMMTRGRITASKMDAIGNIHLTHPDRVYWDDAGVTKQDLAEYFVGIWDWIAPHIVGRPLAVVRCPEGTKGACFFQKHIHPMIRNSPLRHIVDAKEHDVIAVKALDDLVLLAQSGALEIHIRGSRLGSLETCDRIVFDLDPGEDVAWAEIVAAARETRERLSEKGLESFVKLSGGKGIHVVLPIADVDWNTAKTFAQRIAVGMATDSPARYVANMTKALRRGKIFIDYLRNSREATSVAPYSTRARAGAPVSAPLSWDHLSRTTSSNQFTLLNLKKHFLRDAWSAMAKVRQRLAR